MRPLPKLPTRMSLLLELLVRQNLHKLRALREQPLHLVTVDRRRHQSISAKTSPNTIRPASIASGSEIGSVTARAKAPLHAQPPPTSMDRDRPGPELRRRETLKRCPTAGSLVAFPPKRDTRHDPTPRERPHWWIKFWSAGRHRPRQPLSEFVVVDLPRLLGSTRTYGRRPVGLVLSQLSMRAGEQGQTLRNQLEVTAEPISLR
jgi:hypothetical protein